MTACAKKAGDGGSAAEVSNENGATALSELAPQGWASVSADLVDAKGASVGIVLIRAGAAGVMMRLDAAGLTPGWHGVHFHAVGDCSDGAAGFKKAGAHFNAMKREHGLLHEGGSESGDLPNIFAAADGRARAELFRAGLALTGDGGLMDADGFAVVIHAGADDHQSQPIGGAGERVACAAVRE